MLHQVVEVLKHHLREKGLLLLREAGEEAVLYSYSADATPLKVSTTNAHTLADSQVVRKGRALEDFLLQRGLLKTTLATGEQSVAFLFGDILPLSEGKKSGNIFSAAARFFPMLRKAGHVGICISHCVADRALFSSLDRMSRQRLSAYYRPGVGPDLGDERVLLELTDWAVGTGCCAHDMQNALKWALASVATPEDIQNLHIVVESLRNSFDLLLARLPAFLAKHLAFVDDRADLDVIAGFWRDLGVEADMVDLVAEVNPWWESGQLQVSSTLAREADAIEKISHTLLYLCKWRKFSESRWCTVGPCCRTLLWGLCVGLEAWVGVVRSDSSASDFYLHGFSKLSQGIKQYCAVASIASFVPDAVLAEVLVDDRILRNARRLQGLMSDEVGWVEHIGSFTWGRLGAVSGYVGEVCELRGSVVHSSHVAASFIQDKVFSPLKDYPWRLALGDVDENLQILAATGGPIRDSLTHKLRILLQMGYNKARLVSAVTLLREVPWSSVPVEQAHASAAVLHRFHPQYSTGMLATRATLHQARHLFQQPPEDRVAARAARKLEKVRRRAPEQVSGKHAFLAFLMRKAKEGLPSGAKLPIATVRQIVSQHGRLFQELSSVDQAAFHQEALGKAAERGRSWQEEEQHLRAAAQLEKARLSADLLEEGLLNRVSGARFEEEDFESMARLMNSPRFQGSEMRLQRAESTMAPTAPPAHVLQMLDQTPIYAAPSSDVELPKWLKTFAWHRHVLQERGVAVTTDLEEGGEAFLFLFATQRPLKPHFLPLTLTSAAVPCLEGMSEADRMEVWSNWDRYVFDVPPGEYIEASRLPCLSGKGVMVLQGLGFNRPGTMVTNLEPISLETLLELLPGRVKEPKPKTTQDQQSSKPLPPNLVDKFPWLAEFGQQGNASSSQSFQAEGGDATLPAPEPVDAEEVLERAWADLAQKRLEWEVQGPVQGDAFAVEVVDWAWSQGQAGRQYHCIEARASKGDATSWCRKYKFPPKVSFSVKLYTEPVASALAVEWCRRLQFFYDLYRCQSVKDFQYTPAHKESLKDSDAFLLMKTTLPNVGKAVERARAIEGLSPARQ